MGKQTPKMSSRVVNAIRNLREAHGSTSKEIMNYIMSQCNVHESTVNRQVASSYLPFFSLKKKQHSDRTKFAKVHFSRIDLASEWLDQGTIYIFVLEK